MAYGLKASSRDPLKKTLIGYSVHETQSMKYRSVGERHEILCVQTLKLIIYMTWGESLLFSVRLT